MPENKYLKAMELAKQHLVTSPAESQSESVRQGREAKSPEPSRTQREDAGRKLGRPPGKRSNPDWEQVTFFMRTKTKKAALHKLMDSEGRGARDLSEVIDQLVAKWAG